MKTIEARFGKLRNRVKYRRPDLDLLMLLCVLKSVLEKVPREPAAAPTR